MSGFIAIIEGDGKPVDPTLLQSMTDSMATSCPDEQGLWHEGRIGLGHALLKTTWESENEHQPLSLDGKTWITGDIRLDRRDELRGKLRTQGRNLESTAPDVDLLLNAWRIWGEDCLGHISGDFGFALWDGSKQRLFCARDQFGVVPFYYAKIGTTLVVGNHLNCLRRHPVVSDQLNEQTIGDFLLFNMNMDLATTTFADIQRLPPAHTLIWSDGRLHIRRYWQLPKHVERRRFKRPQEYIEQFRALLDRSIADRLRTNRAGTHLSGGLDSTSIATLAYRQLQETGADIDFRAYSMVFKRLIPDEEGSFAAQVASKAGFSVEYLIGEDYIGADPFQCTQPRYPEPVLWIPNQVAETDIMRRTASYSRVLLAGFGGDPGLQRGPLFWAELLRTGRVFHFVEDILGYRRTFGRLPHLRLGLRSELRYRLGIGPQKKPLRYNRDFPNWLNPDFVRRTQLDARFTEVSGTLPYPGCYSMALDPLWSNIFAFLDSGFEEVPLKVRYPFFDLQLVLFLLSIPSMPWTEDKFLLREAMKGILPEAVRQRPKTPIQGFPHYNLIKQNGLQPWMTTLLKTPELTPYASGEALLRMLEDLAELTPVGYNSATPAMHLAYWLRHKVQ